MTRAVEGAARLGEALLSWLGPITLATGAILLAALLADRLLERRVSASVRLLLYGAVLARLALPAGWQTPLGLMRGRASGTVVPGDLDLSMVTVMPLEAAPVPFGASAWAALAYVVVTLALLGRWLHARIALARDLRGALPLGLVIDEVPVMRHPQLGPLVAGLWRPRIVVPAALADQPDPEPLRWVLRHERAHVRRRDLPVGALVQIACLLAWPVLPVWIAARRMRALMEVACDEQAVRGVDGAGRRRYGEVLLALAETTSRGQTLGPVLSFGSPLKGRLRALAARRRWPVVAQAVVVSAVGALALACAGEPSIESASGESASGESASGEESAGSAGSAVADAHTDVVDGESRISNGVGSAAGQQRSRLWLPSRPENATPRATTGTPAVRSAAIDNPFATDRRPDPPGAPVPKRSASVPPPDGRFAPTIRYHGGAIWLYTRRTGSIRVGDAQPLEPAIRDALAETGSRTILVERTWNTPVEIVQRVLEAARRAGATDHAVIEQDHTGQKPAVHKPAPKRFDPILTLTRNGALYLHNELVTLETLETQLRRALAGRGSDTLLLRGDRDARLPQIAGIMAIAKRAGANNVAILSEPSPQVPAPDLVPGQASVRGSLDKEIIRRTIRRHMVQIKACYESQLDRRPGLAGRVSVRFTIAATGAVVASEVADSTLNDATVETCLAQAVRAWEFEKPQGGGIVMVTYPFDFTPSARATGAGQADDSWFSPDVVSERLKDHMPAIKSCYGRHLQQSPASGGRIVFRWVVWPSGKVSEVKLTGPELGEVGPCIGDIIRRVRFPPTTGVNFPATGVPGPLVIEFPFVFQPRP